GAPDPGGGSAPRHAGSNPRRLAKTGPSAPRVKWPTHAVRPAARVAIVHGAGHFSVRGSRPRTVICQMGRARLKSRVEESLGYRERLDWRVRCTEWWS